jgi:hypothetical protein
MVFIFRHHEKNNSPVSNRLRNTGKSGRINWDVAGQRYSPGNRSREL